MKKIKLLSLALTGTLIFSSVPVYANTRYTDSTHEVIEIDTPISKDDNSNCDVYAEIGSEFKVTIPKHITLDGATKKGTYNVSVEGDIAGKETIKVIPDEAVTLSSKDKTDVIGTIAQDKTKWSYNEILSDNKVLGNGLIDANKITAGAWNGTFNFNISLTENSITVTAKNESGEDLNTSSNLIEGEQRENLLNGLVESGLVDSVDDVDALIDVDSDDFDGLADTTFDVSSIAKEGDTIVIVHFDEEKQMWEHVATETVDSEGKISGNFSSYSPIGFIIIDSTGNQTVHTEHKDDNNDTYCDICNKQGTIVYNYHKHSGTETTKAGCYQGTKSYYQCGEYQANYCVGYGIGHCANNCGESDDTYYVYEVSTYCDRCGSYKNFYLCGECKYNLFGSTDGNNFVSGSVGRIHGYYIYAITCGKTTSTIESQYTRFE